MKEDKVPEINLKTETIEVKAKVRELKKDFDYQVGMYEKEIEEKARNLRSELKFHGFTMSEIYLDEMTKIKSADFHNVKKDEGICKYLSGFINLEIDEMVDILKNFDVDSILEEDFPEDWEFDAS